MDQNSRYNKNLSERGGASLKLLIAIVLIAVIGNAGYNYIPVAFDGYDLKEEMGTAVVRGMAASGRNKPADVVRMRLKKALKNSNVPPNAVVEIKKGEGGVQARVSYTKTVELLPLGLYQYDYVFDHTATPTGF